MKFWAVAILAIGLAHAACAEELAVKMTYLGLERPSPFQAQLVVQIVNEGFMSVPVLEKLKASELLVDGHPFKRADAAPWNGPEGLAPQGSWEGCMRVEDYVSDGLAPGTHHLQLRIGESLSKETRVHVEKKEPAASTAGQRLRQAEPLKDILSPGLLRSCVENWLTERDGGLAQATGGVRYYLDPDVKILVSYKPSQPEQRVKDRIRIYHESRILD